MFGRQFAPYKERERNDRSNGEHHDGSRIEPVFLLAALEHVLQRRDPNDEQHNSLPIDPADLSLVLRLFDIRPGKNSRCDADRNVHKEDPRPRKSIDDPSPKRWADRRPDNDT
jgi:hypothetical protein